MATINTVTDEYVLLASVNDQASEGVDGLTAKLTAFEPAADKAAAAAKAMGATMDETGQKFSRADATFATLARKYDPVTKAAMDLAAAQRELEVTQRTGAEAVKNGSAQQAQLDATTAKLIEKINRLAAVLGAVRAEAVAGTEAQAAWNGQIGAGAATAGEFAAQVSIAAQATKQSAIEFATWTAQGQQSSAAMTRFNAGLATYTAGMTSLRAEFDPVFAAQTKYEAAVTRVGTAVEKAGLSEDLAAQALARANDARNTAIATMETQSAVLTASFAALDKYNAGLDAQRASLDPVFASSQRYATNLRSINDLLEATKINSEQAAAMTERETQAFAAANQPLSNLVAAQKELEGVTRASFAALDKYNAGLDTQRASIDPVFASSQRYAASLRVVQDLLAAEVYDADQATAATARLTEEFAAANQPLSNLVAAQRELEGVTRASFAALDQYNSGLDAQRASLDPVFASSERYARNLETVNELLAATKINSDQAAAMTARVTEEFAAANQPLSNLVAAQKELESVTRASFAALDQYNAGLDVQRASLDPVFASSQRYAANLITINELLAATKINSEQAAAMTERETAAFSAANQPLGNLVAAQKELEAVTRASFAALDQYNAGLDAQRASLDPVFANSQRYAANLTTINDLLVATKINSEQAAAMTDRETQAFAAANQPLSNLVAAQEQLEAVTRASFAALDQYNAGLDAQRASLDPVFASSQRYADNLRGINELLAATKINSDQAAAMMDRETEAFAAANQPLSNLIAAQTELETVTRASFAALDQYNAGLDAQRASIDPVFASSQRYGAALTIVNDLLAATKINSEQAAAMTAQITEAFAAANQPLSNFVNAQKELAAVTQASFAALDRYETELDSLRGTYDKVFANSQAYAAELANIQRAVDQTGLSEENAAAARANAAKTYLDGAAGSATYAASLDAQRAKFDPLFRALQTYEAQIKELNTTIATTDIPVERAAEALNILNAGYASTVAAIGRAQEAAKNYADVNWNARFAQQQLAVQVVQFGYSLDAGMPFMQAFIQQGHQIVDVAFATGTGFGVLAAAVKNGWNAVAGWVIANPATAGVIALTVAVGALSYIAESAARAAAQLRAELSATRDDSTSMALAVHSAAKDIASSTTLTTAQATTAATAFAAIPGVAGPALVGLGQTLAGLARAMGNDIPGATTLMTNALRDPAKAALEMASATRPLVSMSAATLDAVMSLQQLGDRSGATKLVLDAMAQTSAAAAAQMTPLQQSFHDLDLAMNTAGKDGKTFGQELGEAINSAASVAVRALAILIQALRDAKEARNAARDAQVAAGGPDVLSGFESWVQSTSPGLMALQSFAVGNVKAAKAALAQAATASAPAFAPTTTIDSSFGPQLPTADSAEQDRLAKAGVIDQVTILAGQKAVDDLNVKLKELRANQTDLTQRAQEGTDAWTRNSTSIAQVTRDLINAKDPTTVATAALFDQAKVTEIVGAADQRLLQTQQAIDAQRLNNPQFPESAKAAGQQMAGVTADLAAKATNLLNTNAQVTSQQKDITAAWQNGTTAGIAAEQTVAAFNATLNSMARGSPGFKQKQDEIAASMSAVTSGATLEAMQKVATANNEQAAANLRVAAAMDGSAASLDHLNNLEKARAIALAGGLKEGEDNYTKSVLASVTAMDALSSSTRILALATDALRDPSKAAFDMGTAQMASMSVAMLDAVTHLQQVGDRAAATRLVMGALAEQTAAAGQAAVMLVHPSIQGSIAPAAAATNVDPAIIARLQSHEGVWDPQTQSWQTSSAGAVGPMQVKPETFAGMLAQPTVFPTVQGLDLSKPADNVVIGSALFSHLLDVYGGSVRLATLAFHDGEPRINAMLAGQGQASPAAVAEANAVTAGYTGTGRAAPAAVLNAGLTPAADQNQRAFAGVAAQQTGLSEQKTIDDLQTRLANLQLARAGVQAGVDATTPLPAGVAGPVAASVSEDDLAKLNRYDLIIAQTNRDLINAREPTTIATQALFDSAAAAGIVGTADQRLLQTQQAIDAQRRNNPKFPMSETAAAMQIAGVTADLAAKGTNLLNTNALIATQQGQITTAWQDGTSAGVKADIAVAAFNATLAAVGRDSPKFKQTLDNITASITTVTQGATVEAMQKTATATNDQAAATLRVAAAWDGSAVSLDHLNNLEKARAIALNGDLTEGSDKYNQSVRNSVSAMDAAASATRVMAQEVASVNAVSGAFSQAFTTIGDAITASFLQGQGAAVNWGNVLKAVLTQVIQKVTELAVLNPILNNLFGQNLGTLDTAANVLTNSGGGSTTTTPGSTGTFSVSPQGALSLVSTGSSLSGAVGGPTLGSALGLTGEGGLLTGVGGKVAAFLTQNTGLGATTGASAVGPEGAYTAEQVAASTTGGASVLGIAGAVGAGFAAGSLIGNFEQSLLNKTGPAPIAGAAIGTGIGVGAVLLAPATFGTSLLAGALVGGIAGGVGGGLIGPHTASTFSTTPVNVSDGSLAIGKTIQQGTDAFPQVKDLVTEIDALTTFLEKQPTALAVTSQTGPIQVGINNPGGFQDPTKFSDLNNPNVTGHTAFSMLRFSSADPVMQELLNPNPTTTPVSWNTDANGQVQPVIGTKSDGGKSFNTETEFSDWVVKFNAAQVSVKAYLTDTTAVMKALGAETGTVPDSIKAITDAYANDKTAMDALLVSGDLSTQQVIDLTKAEGDLATVRDKSLAAINTAQDAALHQTDLSLTGQILTAQATISGNPADALNAQLYTYDASAVNQRDNFSKQLIHDYGEAFRATTAYGDQMQLLEKAIGTGRLAIIAQNNAAIIAQDKALVAAGVSLITSLHTFLTGITLGASSPLSPQAKLTAAQTDFSTTAAKAASGDATAMGNVATTGQALLDAAKAYYGSSTGYVAMYNQVVGVIKTIAAMTPDAITTAIKTQAAQTPDATLKDALAGLTAALPLATPVATVPTAHVAAAVAPVVTAANQPGGQVKGAPSFASGPYVAPTVTTRAPVVPPITVAAPVVTVAAIAPVAVAAPVVTVAAIAPVAVAAPVTVAAVPIPAPPPVTRVVPLVAAGVTPVAPVATRAALAPAIAVVAPTAIPTRAIVPPPVAPNPQTSAQAVFAASTGGYTATLNAVNDSLQKSGPDTLTASFLATETRSQTQSLVDELQALRDEVKGLRADVVRKSGTPGRLVA